MRSLALPAEARMDLSLEMVQRARLDGEDTLILPLNYRCNSRCRFCIIETEIEARFEDTGRAVFEEVFAMNAAERRFKRLTISGAESTLHPALEPLTRAAIERGGFEVVRVQTNARRLKDPAFARRLYEAGAREYFVSIHGHTPALDARITRSTMSFGEMQRGVANLLALGARVISNTVISADNATHLAGIARFLVEKGIRESQLWSFLQIGDAGQSDQLVSLEVSLAPLLEALEIFEAAGSEVAVKWAPRCLLGRFGDRLDNHQPQMLIRDEFQQRLSDNFGFSCPHARSCRWYGRGCDGLHQSYVAAFGDEADRLVPEPPMGSRS
jgi:molybdenum cofactor biosynthesis enzyme MoaA